jgi:CubicO group peptidase (beta-lactamase class C family)
MPITHFVAAFAVFCVCAAPAAAQAQPADSLRTDATLVATLQRIRAAHDVPALAAAVIHGDKPVQTAAVGVRRAGTTARVTVNDRFHIASCTKGMTAVLAARLVEQRRIQWNSRLVDVLPELRDRIRTDYRTATLQQLLAHAAQMPAYTQFGPQRLEELKALEGSPTEQRMAFLVDVLSQEPPNRATGDAAYSNVGYTAAALMLERASRTSWEALVAQQIFRPLHMTQAGFGWPATSRTPQQPVGHIRRDNRNVPQPIDDAYMLPIALWPAGAVNASITDLAKYATDHLRGLRGQKALLEPSSYQTLHRTLTGDSSGFTLGWGVRNDSVHGKIHYTAGSGGTFFVRMVVIPQSNVAIVVASNSGSAGKATREFIDAVLDKL